jgi:hypothetical protein
MHPLAPLAMLLLSTAAAGQTVSPPPEPMSTA